MLRQLGRFLIGGFLLQVCDAVADDALDALLKKYPAPAVQREVASTTESLPTRPKKRRVKKTAKPVAEKTEAKPAPPAAPVEEKPAEIHAEAPAPEAGPAEAEESLFGDWGGFKSYLHEKGVNLSLKYKADWMNTTSGGLKRGSAFLGNVDVLADTDLEKLAGIKGMKLVLYGLGNHGGKPSEYVGDSFVTSNIEAPSTFRLYEAYLQQRIDDNTAVVFGLRDLNADYYTTPSSGLFLNSSFGISKNFSQTGVNGPSIFPQAAIAAYVKYESPGHFYFQAGAFNATAGEPGHAYGTHVNVNNKNGFLYIWEGGFADDEGERPFKYGVGAWSYSEPVASVDPAGADHVNSGVYFLADQSLTKKLSVFLRHGIAAPQVNRFDRSTEVGFQYKGILPSRPDDALAVGAARGTASGGYRSDTDSTADEMAFEAAYSIHAGRGIEVVPDYQHLLNPGLIKGSKETDVLSLRFKIAF